MCPGILSPRYRLSCLWWPQCTEGHDAEISGAIFGCLLLEQVATFGEYFCRFLRPAVAGRRKEKFYHHHNSKVLRSIFGLVSVMALILRLLPLPSLKGHNSAPWSLIDLNPFPRARPLPGLGARHWKCSKSPFLARVIRVQSCSKWYFGAIFDKTVLLFWFSLFLLPCRILLDFF